MQRNTVVVSWSGGIDSTVLVARLLSAGINVYAVSLGVYGGAFGKRESIARSKLMPRLYALAQQTGASFDGTARNASWIWQFSPDNIEIPRRNKHIIDHLATVYCMSPQHNTRNIGLGAYIGADTWVVKSHVAGIDADTRALTAYVHSEYGDSWRLYTLADFGESRYKSDRVRLGWHELGESLFHTTNCLADSLTHCGRCYKCVERHVALSAVFGEDRTEYVEPPNTSPLVKAYMGQMGGYPYETPHNYSLDGIKMPTMEKVDA